jgi:hypothetical protein
MSIIQEEHRTKLIHDTTHDHGDDMDQGDCRSLFHFFFFVVLSAWKRENIF